MLMFTRGAEHNDPKNPDPKGCTNDTHMENIDSKPESPSENMSGWLSYIHPIYLLMHWPNFVRIMAIQEPYINRHTDQVTTYSQMLGNRFDLLIKPTSKDTNVANMPQVCFFVSKALDPTKWAIQHHTKDLNILTLRTRIGPIHIHNAYNPSPVTGQPKPG
ncbi:uncharacterized protein ACHE_30501A [Aspergillus chevalieri]|uniref:Uncharacterized protein n=1 Tax=Aspergillus chevalieri TaxID=182096 RepID=A0A7R7VM82_ASPCH|nr:uncharacterized protein ACHE_30501A [Aspergillus chevalieri]BCR86514.1 hypothetical protein ACHE_30501A [Aspergillus chevalieri]